MKQTKQRMGWIFASLTLLLLALAGCGGGSGGTAALPTQTTATGTLTAAGGTTPAAAFSVAAPAGVTVTIPGSTSLTDAGGNPVGGSITTSVSYSTTAADLPAAARTLPANATLIAFADVTLASATAQVKNFSNPVALGIQLPAGAAATGDTMAIYSFDAGTGQWSFAHIEKVDATGKVTPAVPHLSVWGVFKSSTAAPARPSTFLAGSGAAGSGSAVLSWAAAADAAYYNVYYSTSTLVGADLSAVSKLDRAATGTGVTVTGLTNGTLYNFVVTAVNPGGESVISAERQVVAGVPLPGNTAGVSVTSPAVGQARVSWTTGVPNATSYNVYFLEATTPPASNAPVLAASVQSSATSPLLLTGLHSGATYYILVRAANSAGEGGTQNTPKAVTIL